MDELYSPCEDKTEKIELNVQPANQYQDTYYEIANLYKKYPKHVVHKHLNTKFSDAERRKIIRKQKLQEKLNQKIIRFD